VLRHFALQMWRLLSENIFTLNSTSLVHFIKIFGHCVLPLSPVVPSAAAAAANSTVQCSLVLNQRSNFVSAAAKERNNGATFPEF
jgi:hypothetical protein